MFKYFVSYVFMKEDGYNSGFGNCFIDFENKITCHNDIIKLQELISNNKNNNFTNILFYKEVKE